MAGSGEGTRTISLTEALEDYSSSHPESIDVLLRWSSRKFEHFYAKHQKRKVVETLERQKMQMIAALWSNSNYDDDKGTRKSAIENIENNYQESIEIIENFGKPEPPEMNIDKSNPFFAATERGKKKLEQRVSGMVVSSDEDNPEYTKEIDQG